MLISILLQCVNMVGKKMKAFPNSFLEGRVTLVQYVLIFISLKYEPYIKFFHSFGHQLNTVRF